VYIHNVLITSTSTSSDFMALYQWHYCIVLYCKKNLTLPAYFCKKTPATMGTTARVFSRCDRLCAAYLLTAVKTITAHHFSGPARAIVICPDNNFWKLWNTYLVHWFNLSPFGSHSKAYVGGCAKVIGATLSEGFLVALATVCWSLWTYISN